MLRHVNKISYPGIMSTLKLHLDCGHVCNYFLHPFMIAAWGKLYHDGFQPQVNCWDCFEEL